MRGEFKELRTRLDGTRDICVAVGRQLRSIHDVAFPRPLPDDLARLLKRLRLADDRMRGRDARGQDRLTRPFAMLELIAAIEALLRGPTESRDTLLRVGPIELDLIERTARRGDRTIDLLPREFRLLAYMMRHKEQILPAPRC